MHSQVLGVIVMPYPLQVEPIASMDFELLILQRRSEWGVLEHEADHEQADRKPDLAWDRKAEARATRPSRGSVGAMIKLVYCITRRRDLSVDEFSRYWHDVHGPIGRRIPGLRRLVQSHPVVVPAGYRMDFDGMAELWFDDFDALSQAQASPEWQASSADEANFIDATRTALFLTEEREIPT